MRKHSEEEVMAYAKEVDEAYARTKDAKMAALKEKAAKQIADIEKVENAKIEDASADYVMAKIHADKSEQEVKELRQKAESLKQEIRELKAARKAEKDEWKFQQFAQAQDQLD